MSDSVKDEAKSYLEMSDEDFLKLPTPSMEDFSAESVEPANDEDADETPEDSAVGDTAEDAEDEAAEGAADAADEDEGNDGEAPEETSDAKPEVNKTDVVNTEVQGDQKDAPPEASVEVDYKTEYEKVFAPFKANGRDITVKTAEDAVSLMQMGANYNKKMAALKPNLKLLKMLEKHELLDEAKLSYLIDLDKKNPDAINKLVKDSGLDPMDFDAEKASEYKPKTYQVDERELELDTVLGDLKDSPSYTRTLEVVGNKWDAASRQVIADTPQLLKVINGHITSGVYDIINQQVEQDRTFGRLDSLTDIEAYRKVGDAIQARGGFDHLGLSQGKQTPPKGTIVTPPKPKADSVELRDKKRAASSTKPAAAKSEAKEFNPLAMSDEEFSKQGIDKFL
jgi:hypothetical protein